MSINFVKKHSRRLHHYFIPCEANHHHPHFIRHGALHFYSYLIISVKIFVFAALAFGTPSTAYFSTVTSSRIIELTNRERLHAGLPLLVHSSVLDESALLKAKNMLAEDYFSHDSPSGKTPWEWFKGVGYNYTFAGENLAMNFSDAEEAVAAWMASPTHKANLVNENYAEIGVAVIVGAIEGRETTIVVQHFGKTYDQPLTEFARGTAEGVPAVAGTTEVSSGQAVEVSFTEPGVKRGFASSLVFYARKFFEIVVIFVAVNLLITVLVHIRIQRKKAIIHSLIVIAIGLSALYFSPHFLERIAGEAVRII